MSADSITRTMHVLPGATATYFATVAADDHEVALVPGDYPMQLTPANWPCPAISSYSVAIPATRLRASRDGWHQPGEAVTYWFHCYGFIIGDLTDVTYWKQ